MLTTAATPHLHLYLFKVLPEPWQHFLRASWPSICISPVSHSQVPVRGPTSLLKQIFSSVPPSAHQYHWFLTMAHTQPCAPHHLIPPMGEDISSSSQLTYLLNFLEETAEKLHLVSCASVTRFTRHDVGNGQEMPTICMAASAPLLSMTRLSGTPRPDLALFRAAFLTQTFESDLEQKTNRKPNTLPNTLIF